MPDLAFAAGALNGFLGTMDKERARKDANNRFIVKTLLESGRVANIGDLAPFLNDQLSPTGTAPKPKSGGGGKGKQPDPTQILGLMLNPILQKHHDASGQPGVPGAQNLPASTERAPLAGATNLPGTPQGTPTNIGGRDVNLLTSGDVAQISDQTDQRKLDREFEDFKRREKITAAEKERLAKIQAEARNANTIKARIQTEIDAAQQAKGDVPLTDEETAAAIDKGRAAWQSAGRKLNTEELHVTAWLKDAEAENGGKLSASQEKVERLKARKAWKLASLQETPDQKLSRAKALADYREHLTAFTPEDLQALAQTADIGGKKTSYIDMTGFTGKEGVNARVAAIKNGLIPVTDKQTEQLESSSAASANAHAFLDQILSKLPKDAQGRVLGGPSNKLSALFQTDDELASAVGWDTTIFPTLRALNVSGRISNQEIDLAKAARPKITDTVAVAQRFVQILDQQLRNASDRVLERGVKSPAAAAGVGGADAARRNKVRERLVTNGYKATDDTIDQYLKNHPDFK